MNPAIASCTLDVSPPQRESPFVLSTAPDLGNRPVQLYPMQVSAWSQRAGLYDPLLPMAVRTQSMGMRRVRLYCSERPEQDVRLVVHGGGAVRALGRRTEPRLETLTWLQSHDQSLRYYYNQPKATIVESTRFFDNNGQEVAKPLYDPAQGLFHHAQPVTGALVVSYEPGFFLYEIEYDTGESEMTAKAFQAMQRAWLAGNIRDALIPPVRIIALSGQQAAQTAFPRTFWPEHSSAALLFQDEVKAPVMGMDIHTAPGGYSVDLSRMSPCWLRCRDRLKPGATLFTQEELAAIQACVEKNSPQQSSYQYVESKRESRTERIYSRDDPDTYIDVERTIAMTLEKKSLQGGLCEGEDGQSQTLSLRFKSN
ncbi:MAG: hypothetical protein HQL90_11990 [Magnetococcales bacterium]|nr:hypothetical protein [Magnetococcales bacterium]